MGLWSWFFPSPADRVAKARTLLARERWADARLEVLELDHPDAPALIEQAETELAKINLHAAVEWAKGGDEQRVLNHLDLAEQFHHGGLESLFQDTRRQLRELRAERGESKRREAEQEAARRMAADPLGVTGGPSWLDRTMPADLLDPDDEEAAARLALTVESYHLSQRASVGALGAAFARAVLDLEDGRPDLAVQGLLTLPDDQPVVRYERARAAYTLGDPASAARELRAFASLVGGHLAMGRYHTAEFLALCLAEAGRPAEGLQVLRAARVAEPKLGGALFAQLLEATGDLSGAERSLAELIRAHPRDMGLYQLLARVRLAGGHREQAKAALESALQACGCGPGMCGTKTPDIGVVRGLALLYLEDVGEGGGDGARGLELAAQARGMVKQPTWEDAYLAALEARASRSPDAERMAAALWENTPDGDRRQQRLARFLPGPERLALG